MKKYIIHSLTEFVWMTIFWLNIYLLEIIKKDLSFVGFGNAMLPNPTISKYNIFLRKITFNNETLQ